jgi:hypothetical protein
MATVPKYPYFEKPQRRQRVKMAMIKPTGHFKRPDVERPQTDRSPESVTSINPKGMEPILPEMVYIPPA